MKDNNQLHSSDSRSLIKKYEERSAKCDAKIKELQERMAQMEEVRCLINEMIVSARVAKADNQKMIAMLNQD